MDNKVIFLFLVLLSFNLNASEDKKFKCDGDLYFLKTPSDYQEDNVEFYLFKGKNLIFKETNSYYFKIKEQDKYLSGNNGLFFTNTIDNYSFIFSFDKENDKYKYHYVQTRNGIYEKVISIGYCATFYNI